jgi:hypothetical protein
MGPNRGFCLWEAGNRKGVLQMKKNMLCTVGILAVLLVSGLALAGCPTEAEEGDNNPFVGNWTGTASIGGESASATINATDSAWTFNCPAAQMSESGTYTRSGNTATLTQGGSPFGTATVSGSSLIVTITFGNYAGGTGTFTK